MKFTDYTIKQLIGKFVLWTTSDQVIDHNTARVLPITEVTNKGFKLLDVDKVFDYFTGHEKPLNNIAVNKHSKCKLLSDEEKIDFIDRLTQSKMLAIKHKYKI